MAGRQIITRFSPESLGDGARETVFAMMSAYNGAPAGISGSAIHRIRIQLREVILLTPLTVLHMYLLKGMLLYYASDKFKGNIHVYLQIRTFCCASTRPLVLLSR